MQTTEVAPKDEAAPKATESFYRKVTRVHLEVTAKCNAACPQCFRNYFGGPNRVNLEEAELSLKDVKEIFPESFLRQLELLYVNGNYGDGAVAKDITEIFQYFRAAAPNLHLMLFTNGSLRTPDWWGHLGTVINEIFWGIDGLEDTNHLYRRNTNFKKIIANAEAFNKTGAKSVWVFNVFKHNEHQVEEARAMSKNLGFTDFIVRKTARFEFGGKINTKLPVFSRTGNLEYYLEMPTADRLVNEGYAGYEKTDHAPKVTLEEIMKFESAIHEGRLVIENPPSMESYLSERREISCLAQAEQSIYVSSTGHVYPCCWIGSYTPLVDPAVQEVKKLHKSMPQGLDGLNARQIPITKIIENIFFQKVQASWNKGSVKDGILSACSRQCGTHDGNCYKKQLDQFHV
jgi:MoaA/NifB/PqqE/SkfB family radical SAM enzyme